jgi:hypothetical protein
MSMPKMLRYESGCVFKFLGLFDLEYGVGLGHQLQKQDEAHYLRWSGIRRNMFLPLSLQVRAARSLFWGVHCC